MSITWDGILRKLDKRATTKFETGNLGVVPLKVGCVRWTPDGRNGRGGSFKERLEHLLNHTVILLSRKDKKWWGNYGNEDCTVSLRNVERAKPESNKLRPVEYGIKGKQTTVLA